MKTIKSYILGFVGLALLAASCDKVDYPDRFRATEGLPTVQYVRYADKDVFTNQAYMDEILCIVGSNLKSVHKVYFNDQAAILNTSYITDHTLVVAVPSTQAVEVDNLIHLYNAAGEETTFEFKVLPPVPKISSMSNEWAKEGENVTLYGKYFMDVQSLSLPGVEVTDYQVVSSEQITFNIPAGATSGPVSIVTASGSANSVFHYMDQRNILFDFDGSRGGFAQGNGWRAPAAGHIHNDGDDAFAAIDGSYLWLGGWEGGLKADATGVWAEDSYSFDYWNSSDPTSAIPPLNTLPTFASYIEKYGVGSLALKFECLVPSSNPWASCSMQLIFSSSDIVSNENMNNTYFSDANLPRGLWTPWKATGSYDTADKWVTVSVPLSEFTYSHLGDACGTQFSSSYLDGFALFVWAGYSGADCDPVIAIDNIRVVPL